MEVRISGVYTYVPTWRGNNKLPPEEQISIEHTYLSPEEEEKYTTFFPVYKGKEEIELEVKSNACAIWNSCVKKVIGFVDADTKQPVTDPLKVGKIPGIYGLLTEVVAHIKNGFDEGELKNSE